MFWFLEAGIGEALAFAPEFLFLVGAPELPPRRRPRFIKVRGPGMRTVMQMIVARD